jgi:hypothetical protein
MHRFTPSLVASCNNCTYALSSLCGNALRHTLIVPTERKEPLSTLANRREAIRAVRYHWQLLKESHVVIGGGLLGTILIIALIAFLMRRSRL